MSKAHVTRAAVIDVGTLKSKFEIREQLVDGSQRVLYKDKKLTVLGRDLTNGSTKIGDGPIRETVAALREFKRSLVEYNVDVFDAVATEALRKADNASAVLKGIARDTGITLRILSHDDEAALFFKHVARDFTGKRIAVADIGGGSVQLTIGSDKGIEHTHLYKTGTYFMQEEFYKTHRSTAEEIAAAKAYVHHEFKTLAGKHLHVDELVYGSTNIVDFMCAMDVRLQPSGYPTPHAYRAKLTDLHAVYQRIIKYSYEERMPMFPAEPYYMWSADNALLNIFEMAAILELTTVIPSNENISSGLFGQLFGAQLH